MTEEKSELDSFIDKSKVTDRALLLTAKEKIKQKIKDDPSANNLQALDRATRMLDNAVSESKVIKGWESAVAYLNNELNRKVGKSKFFADLNKGRVKKQPDGTFKITDLNKYGATLDVLSVPEGKVNNNIDLAQVKLQEEIRRTKALADKEEFALHVRRGGYLPKDRLYQELASRAMALSSSLKTAVESNALDLIFRVEGKPQKSQELITELHSIIDDYMSEYSKEFDLEVVFNLNDIDIEEDGI